jgi:acyl-CoA synthetase (AMP-forming)/AMP-acid ligase II
VNTLASILDPVDSSATALLVPDGPRFSYGELAQQVLRAADVLSYHGVRSGTRVAVVLPNGAEAVLGFLAAAIAGTACPLNPAYTEDEFRFYMEDTGADALIVPQGGAPAARAALPEGARLLEAILEPGDEFRLECSATGRFGEARRSPTPDDVALVLHTSGTTSRPKRVPLTHENLTASVRNIVGTYGLGPTDVSYCVMPLFHVHGLLASTLATLGSGGTVVVPSRFNPLRFWSALGDHRATWYSAVPTIHQLAVARLRQGERAPGTEHLRFIRSCSSALAPSLMAQLESCTGVPVLEAYGMTEAAHQMASNPLPPARRLPGSVGVGTGVQVAVMDDGGTLLPTGSVGEVVIQGPNVTRGYESNPEANAASFTNGWFRTGDQGSLDGDGYLTLLGRIKELINRGGEKISPREIDEVLLEHPAVAEAVCFGVPHAVWGEEVAAAVVLRSDASPGELQKHCRERLAEFKCPRAIYVTEQIPRTATGKIQRRHVAAAFTASN